MARRVAIREMLLFHHSHTPMMLSHFTAWQEALGVPLAVAGEDNYMLLGCTKVQLCKHVSGEGLVFFGT